MERTLTSVYRCLTCKIPLDGEAASNEHEKETLHKVKRTKIIIVPPQCSNSGGVDIRCIVGGSSASNRQRSRSTRPPYQNLFMRTPGGQLVRQRVLPSSPRPILMFITGRGTSGGQQRVPAAIREARAPTAEARAEGVGRQETRAQPAQPGNSGATRATTEYLGRSSQRGGGGKTPSTKRVLGSVRYNRRSDDNGGRRNGSS